MEKNSKVIVCPLQNGFLVYPKSVTDLNDPPHDSLYLIDHDALAAFFRDHADENPEGM